MKRSKKGLVIISILIVVMFIALLVSSGKMRIFKGAQSQESLVNELPLRYDEIPISFNIINSEERPILEAEYTNGSKYDISNLSIEIKLKDSGEILILSYNKELMVGQRSGKFQCNGPISGKIEDVEILKYKISLKQGVYVEYDTQINQYNWS